MFHHRLHQYNLNEVLQRPCKLLKRNALVKQFVISKIATAANLLTLSQKIAPEKNCLPPALILTLVLNQTLTLTGGQFSLEAIFRTPFYSVQYKNGWLAASDLFDMFTQSVKFIIQ